MINILFTPLIETGLQIWEGWGEGVITRDILTKVHIEKNLTRRMEVE
jgi:phospholipid N-methyltransferase